VQYIATDYPKSTAYFFQTPPKIILGIFFTGQGQIRKLFRPTDSLERDSGFSSLIFDVPLLLIAILSQKYWSNVVIIILMVLPPTWLSVCGQRLRG